jgi:hypothetical protein
VHAVPDGNGQAVPGWPGAALAVAALGLLLAAAPAAEWLAHAGAGRGAGRKLLAGVAIAAAATAPVLAAVFWVSDGVRGPVGSVTAPVLPAFVSASSNGGSQYRTLVLRPDGDSVDYAVVRQSDPILGEPELTAYGPAQQTLSEQVSALGSQDGADAGDPGLALSQFGIKWVLLPGPVDTALAQRLDASVGLVPLSKSAAYDLWEVAGPVARVRVIAPDGTVTPLPSQPVDVTAVAAPPLGGTLVLAEPYGGWAATLNGKALKPLSAPVDGWAQGFVLPAGGGKVAITRNNVARDLSLVAELVALLAVCVLALPGKRADPAAEAEALAAVQAARRGRRAARVAQRPGLPRRARLAGRAAAGFGAVRRRGAAATEGADQDVTTGSGVGVLTDSDDGDWDDGDGWDEGGAWQKPARLTGPQPAAPRGTGPQQAAPWESGSQQAAPWESGPQPAAPWDTGPRPASRNTGPHPSWDTGPHPSAGTGPHPSAGTGPHPSAGTVPPPADRDTGPRRSAPPERHSHRARRRGSRPSHRRGDRSGTDGES